MDAEQRFHARFFGSLRGTLDCLSWRRICCLRNTGLDAKSPQLLVTTGSCGLTLSLEAVQGQSVTSIARSADIHAETKSSLPVIGTVTYHSLGNDLGLRYLQRYPLQRRQVQPRAEPRLRAGDKITVWF